jgi:hypothetical protein
VAISHLDATLNSEDQTHVCGHNFVFPAEAGETVVEVGALKRAREAKNDRIDAIRAARDGTLA